MGVSSRDQIGLDCIIRLCSLAQHGIGIDLAGMWLCQLPESLIRFEGDIYYLVLEQIVLSKSARFTILGWVQRLGRAYVHTLQWFFEKKLGPIE